MQNQKKCLHKIILFFSVLVFFNSCAPTRLVKPLQKGEQQVNVSLGGPLINFAGTTIPIPFSSVTYARGLSDETSLYGSLHTTSALFGVFQSELGLLHQLKQADSLKWYKLGVSVSPSLNFLIDRWEGTTRLWPKNDFTVYSLLGKNKRHLIYLGLSQWFDFYNNKAHGVKNMNLIPSNFHYGFMINKGKWNHQLDVKMFLTYNKNIVVDYFSPVGTIPWGLYYSVSKNF